MIIPRALNGENRLDRPRRGSSLVEVLLVISALAVLLATAMTMAQTLLRADKAGKSALAELQRVDALADRFRDDAHGSERALSILPAQVFAADSGKVQASTPKGQGQGPSQPLHQGGLDLIQGDRIIEYRAYDDLIERIVRENDNGKRIGREIFMMSGKPSIGFLIDTPGSPGSDEGMAVLTISQYQGREREGRRKITRIEAALARRPYATSSSSASKSTPTPGGDANRAQTP